MGHGSVSQTSTWFLVETNYDHWNKPPFYDDRRTPAIYCLEKMGREAASPAGIYNVLSTVPVLNKVGLCSLSLSDAFVLHITN